MSGLVAFRSTFRHIRYLGEGAFSGLAPDPEVPDSPDGRFRINNEPARGRIVVFDRGSSIAVAETVSAEDGTWLISGLDPERFYTVVGYDGSGGQNAAIQDWVKPYVPE